MNTLDNPLLHQLAALDPAREKAATGPETIERTRQWVLGHDRPSGTTSVDLPPASGVAGLATLLEREPVTPQVRPIRRTRRRVALVGAGVVMVLGMVGVLPSLLPDGGTTPPAAAIPMLEYTQPDGVDGPTALQQLADQLRESATVDESGRYFFEYRRDVGYSMHEVEVSDEHWVVDRLERREDDSYYWFDTTDLSGGRLYLRDGDVMAPEIVFPAGEASLDLIDTPDTPQALYDLVLWDPDAQRFPGHYLIDAYNVQANRLDQRDRATFLDAIALVDDVTSYGQVTDRNGRDGVAFGASRFDENVEFELIMILDPTTGQVLELDRIYPNDLPGAPDVVKTYNLVVDSRYTDTLPPCGSHSCPGVSSTTSD